MRVKKMVPTTYSTVVVAIYRLVRILIPRGSAIARSTGCKSHNHNEDNPHNCLPEKANLLI